jgi:hypothetical protein
MMPCYQRLLDDVDACRSHQIGKEPIRRYSTGTHRWLMIEKLGRKKRVPFERRRSTIFGRGVKSAALVEARPV